MKDVHIIYLTKLFHFLPFLYIAMAALENMGFVANMVSLVMYFSAVMLLDNPTAANTLTNFMGSTFLLTLIGAYISDTYLSRLSTALFFGVLEVLVS